MFYGIRLPLFLFCFLPLLLLSQNSSIKNDLLINEVGFIPGTDKSYIELIVINEDNSSLAGWILDNYDEGPVVDNGFIIFSDDFPTLPTGALILIYNDLDVPAGINATFNNQLTSDGFIQIPFSSHLLIKEATTHSSSLNWGNFLSITNTQNGIYTKDPLRNTRTQITWGVQGQTPAGAFLATSTLGAIAPTTTSLILNNPCLSSPPSTQGPSISGGTLGYTAGTPSPGRFNSWNNRTTLQLLQNGSISNIIFDINCTQISAANPIGAIRVELDGGLGPFTANIEGPDNNAVVTFYPQHAEISVAQSGQYFVTITDSRGCKRSCSTYIATATETVEVCEGEPIIIGRDLSEEECGFKWKPEIGLLSPDNSITEAEPSADEEITYQLIISDGEGGIQTIEEYKVKVNEGPEVTIEPDPASFCDGELELKAITDANESFFHEWTTTSSNPITNPSNQPSIILEENELLNNVGYKVEITDANGCTATAEINLLDANDPQAVKSYLTNAGFYCVEVEIPPVRTVDLEVILDGDNVQVRSVIDDFFQTFEITGNTFATENSDFCVDGGNYITQIKSDFQSSAYAVWAHLFHDEENSGNTGELCLKVQSPFENTLDIADGPSTQMINTTIDYFESNGIGTNEFINFGAQQVYIILEQLNNDFLIALDESIFEEATASNASSSIIPCVSTTFPEHFITPSGVVVTMPEGTTVRYIPVEASGLNGNFDTRAFVGFSLGLNIYTGRLTADYQNFVGYRPLGTKGDKAKFDFPNLQNPTGEPEALTVNFGFATGTYPEVNITITLLEYTSFTPPIDAFATGNLQSALDFSEVGVIVNDNSNFSRKYKTGLPEINIDVWDASEKQAWVEENQGAENWIWMEVFTKISDHPDATPVSVPVRGIYEYGSDEVTFYIWDCKAGMWWDASHFIEDTTEGQEMSFIAALFQVISITGHTMLDVAGLVPIFGEIADATNGVWYLLEGNNIEAALSLGAIIPVIGGAVIGSKFVAKAKRASGQIYDKVKYFGRADCTPLGFNPDDDPSRSTCPLSEVTELAKKMTDDINLKTAELGFNEAQYMQLIDDVLVETQQSKDLAHHFYKNLDHVGAWKSITPDEVLRKNPDKLSKVDNYAVEFSESLDNIGNEFANIPSAQRSGWIDHLEYRTKSTGTVNKPGNRSSDYGTFGSNSDVPQKYSSDNRFTNLAADPAVGNTTAKTRQEAMAGLEAESQGVLINPISREPSGNMEFYDGNGSPWDVKGPRGGNFFDVNQVGASIRKELRDKGPFPNGNTGIPEARKVILDCTYINGSELTSLKNWLSANLNVDELARIRDINSNLF